jgi:putative transposase
MVGVNLKEWAAAQGVAYITARRQYAAGTLPVPTYRLGRLIMVGDPLAAAPDAGEVVVYGRVSSADQRADLDRQVARVTTWATGQHLAVARVVTEVGSALNGRRKKFLALLRDPAVSTIVVEHRDRFARFGAEYVEAALAAQGRRLLVVDPAEVDDDLVRDVTEILTSLCPPVRASRGREPCPPRGCGDRDGPAVIVNQAYRFAVDPTPAQVRDLASHAGASRKAFNGALGLIKAQLDQREAEKSYGIPAEDLTPFVRWSLPSLRKRWNAVKDDVAPWWADNSKEAYASGIRNLVRGLDAWRDSKSGKRKGPPVRFPRLKSKRRETVSCTFTTGAIRIEDDRRHVTLPRLGAIRLHESARKLARRIDAGTARILSATVKREAGRWFVSFACEVDRAIRTPARPDAVVGVDVGISHLAVLSTGETIANPRHLNAASKHLRRTARRLSRRVGPDRRIRRKASKRWERAKVELGKAHARVANLRRDGLHKLTTQLAATHGTVVIENLNVAGMVRNRRLARAISDCGFGMIRQQLTYKTEWNGGRLVVADRRFPSSKTCSGCGVVKAKLPLRVRTFVCPECGMVLDRDLNAARNLALLVSVTGAGVAVHPGPEGLNGRRADRKTQLAGPVAVKRLPGTASAGQAGPSHRKAGLPITRSLERTERKRLDGRPGEPRMLIRPMEGRDAGAVLRIYQAGLDTGDASFETTAPDWPAFDAARRTGHRHVAVDDSGAVVGWVAVSSVSTRPVYAGVVEHSVYVDPAARGRGLARRLLDALVASTEAAGVWTIQSGVFPENTISLALHQKAGFRVVGTRERVGRHHGRWRDVVLIERRSPEVS